MTLFIFILRWFINWSIAVIVFQFFKKKMIDAECIKSYWHCRFKDNLPFHINNRQVVSHWCVVSKIFRLQLITGGRLRAQCTRSPMLTLLTWLPFSCTNNTPPFQHLLLCSLFICFCICHLYWNLNTLRFLISSMCPVINTMFERWFVP